MKQKITRTLTIHYDPHSAKKPTYTWQLLDEDRIGLDSGTYIHKPTRFFDEVYECPCGGGNVTHCPETRAHLSPNQHTA